MNIQKINWLNFVAFDITRDGGKGFSELIQAVSFVIKLEDNYSFKRPECGMTIRNSV
ncbi:MAG TPA: hypothetical protein VH500_13850 [Nitrososphaeraceae archaeon]